MHLCILKLVYIHNDLLHISTKHMAIFREVKIQRVNTLKIIIGLLKFQKQSTDIK